MKGHKIMLLGEIGVGKTSIAQRLVFNRFRAEYKPTIGVQVYTYAMSMAEGISEPSNLIVWDTDGNLGDFMFRHVYMKAASAALIIGDLTRRETFDTMVRLAEGFNDAQPGRYIGFLLNKEDLVANAAAIPLPKPLMAFPRESMLTSAKNGKNVIPAFVEAVNAVIRRGH